MKQGELNVFLIAKYPVKVYFNAKVMMYEFALVTKQTIYVYLSWQRILMNQYAESFGFVENVTYTMKLMRFSFSSTVDGFECSRELKDQSLIVSVLVCATTAGLPYVFGVFYKGKNEIKYKYEIR